MALDAAGERQLQQGDLYAANPEPGASHERIDVDGRRPERGDDAITVTLGQRLRRGSRWLRVLAQVRCGLAR